MSVLKSEFRPVVCCEHDWSTQDFTDLGVREEDHVWECWKCGATCKRGRDGSIVQYSLNADVAERRVGGKGKAL